MNISKKNMLNLMNTPIQNHKQYFLVLLTALAFLFMPQSSPIDWKLNTDGYWTSFPDTYLDSSKVYPPWGLILMLPYYWMRAEGARVLSVLTIGWLSTKYHWSLVQFLSIVLSPYFFVTMTKSNLDIFVFVLPILLWEVTDGTRWQNLGWASAMSLALLKPQGMVFIWIYWLWTNRKRWREMLIPFSILTLVTVPISVIGSPSLFMQWLSNLQHPSLQNELWWAENNISITSNVGLFPGLALILLVVLLVIAGVRLCIIYWSKNHTYASFLALSFFLMPYASQQSASAIFAFIPSWQGTIIQIMGIALGLKYLEYNQHVAVFVFFFVVLSLLFFRPAKIIRQKT